MGSILAPVHRLTAPPAAGVYEIDWSNPLTKGLAFAQYGGFDYVFRHPGRPVNGYGQSSRGVSAKGKYIESNSTTNGGWAFDTSELKRRIGGQPLLSIVMGADIDSYDSWGELCNSPADKTAWVSPNVCAGLLRQSSQTVGRFQFATGPTTSVNSRSSSGYLDTGVFRQYSVTKEADGSVNFYKDGQFFSVGTTSSTSDITILQNRVNIFSRNDAATDEGVNGRCNYCFYFAKDLSAREHEALSKDPWQILREKRKLFFVPDGGSPPVTATVPIMLQSYRQRRV